MTLHTRNIDKDGGGQPNPLLFSWEIGHNQAQFIELYLVLLLDFNLYSFVTFIS